MKLISLHLAYNEELIRINSEFIISYKLGVWTDYTGDKKIQHKCTELHLFGFANGNNSLTAGTNSRIILIKETPEEIDKLIMKGCVP